MPLNSLNAPVILFDDRSKVVLLLFMFHVYLCYVVLSVPCNLVITCWEKAGLLDLSCVVFSCVLSLPGQVLCLIVWIPDFCLPLSFECRCQIPEIKWYYMYHSTSTTTAIKVLK